MSRCFPFPPPGYEKKISTDEAHSLIKVTICSLFLVFVKHVSHMIMLDSD